MTVAKQYEILPDGGIKIHLPSGIATRTALRPEQLEAVGYAQKPPAPEGQLADAGAAPEKPAPVWGSPEANALFKEKERKDKLKSAVDAVTGGYKLEKPGGTPKAEYFGLDPQKLKEGEKEREAALKQAKEDPDATEVEVPDGAAGSAGAAVAPRRIVVSPGGMVRSGVTVQQGVPGELIPDKDTLDTNAEMGDRALVKQANADAEQLRDSADAMDAADQYTARGEEIIAKRRASVQQELRLRWQQIEDERLKVENSQIDPGRFYNNMSAPAKAMAFVGALGAGIRAGIQGGENQFFKRMDRLAEQDIQQQKDLIGLRERGISSRRTQLDKLTELMMGDQEAAEAQLRLQYGAMGDSLLRAAAANSGNAQIQAKLFAALQMRKEQREFQAANMYKEFGAKTVEQFSRVAPQVVEVGGARAPTSKREIERADAIRAGSIRVRGKEGLVRGNPDSTSVRYRQTEGNTFEAFMNDLNTLYALAQRAEQSGNPNMISEVRRRITSAKKKIGPTESVLTGQGAMSLEEIKRVDDSLSAIDSLISKDNIGGEALSAIDQTRQLWENSFKTWAENTIVELPGDPQSGVAPWQDDAGFYAPRPFTLPKWKTPAEPQVRD